MKTRVWLEAIDPSDVISQAKPGIHKCCRHRSVAGTSLPDFGIANGPQGRGYINQLRLC